MPRPLRIPGRLLTCQEEGQRANTKIREIIRDLARKKETNLGVIYAQLHLVLAEVDANDDAWERLEFETREEIRQENKNGSCVDTSQGETAMNDRFQEYITNRR